MYLILQFDCPPPLVPASYLIYKYITVAGQRAFFLGIVQWKCAVNAGNELANQRARIFSEGKSANCIYEKRAKIVSEKQIHVFFNCMYNCYFILYIIYKHIHVGICMYVYYIYYIYTIFIDCMQYACLFICLCNQLNILVVRISWSKQVACINSGSCTLLYINNIYVYIYIKYV